jgi:xylulokinase
MKYIISYDLGTGGIKSSIFNEVGEIIISKFFQCNTYYPKENLREQKPKEWFSLLKKSTKYLLDNIDIDKNDIVGIGISGHSLGVVPISYEDKLLIDSVPIWSDSRAMEVSSEFFKTNDEDAWYMKTGNGFPSFLYSAFKIRWYKEHNEELYNKTKVFIGTKDYLNWRLTNVLVTDYSYASGSGVFNLNSMEYDIDLINKMGLDLDKFPKILESSSIVGTLNSQMAKELNLSEKTIVSAGGVDNACMAFGAGCVTEGSSYTSLGTSAWIATLSTKPILDAKSRPYVFAGLQKGTYVSAEAIFSAGNTHRWVRDILFKDVEDPKEKDSLYKKMDEEAESSKNGSNGLFFIPTLAGGTMLDDCVDVKGAIVGLSLDSQRADIIRASLEGVCYSLKIALDELLKQVELNKDMIIVGGGVKSKLWRSLFANIYSMDIIQYENGENAGALGAMGCAAIASGLWKDFSPLQNINKIKNITKPDVNEEFYKKNFVKFKYLNKLQSQWAKYLKENS